MRPISPSSEGLARLYLAEGRDAQTTANAVNSLRPGQAPYEAEDVRYFRRSDTLFLSEQLLRLESQRGSPANASGGIDVQIKSLQNDLYLALTHRISKLQSERSSLINMDGRIDHQIQALKLQLSTILPQTPEEPGMPTFNEVRSCFSEIRAYYKRGEKSSNKFYFPLQRTRLTINGETKEVQTFGPGYSPKTERRNLNALRSAEITLAQPRRQNTPLREGRILYADKIKAGNCGVMTDIAANLFKKRFPEAPLYYVTTPDHTLMVCGAIPPANQSVDSWKDYQFNPSSYVIDVWMNICCKSNEYPSQVKEKLDKWAAEGKGVLSGSRDSTNKRYHVTLPLKNGIAMGGVANAPNSQSYINTLLSTTAQIKLIE